MNWREIPWGGLYAATLCAFNEDESIDEEGLSQYMTRLANVEGIRGLTCNGHTGDDMTLRPEERARVTHIVSQAVIETQRPVKVISGVSAEGSLEAIDHALAAKEAVSYTHLPLPTISSV